MEMPSVSEVKRHSFFEEHKKVVHSISAALVALALIAAIYVGIKAGIFSLAITYATLNPLLTGVLLALTLIAVGACIWLVFFKENAPHALDEKVPSKETGKPTSLNQPNSKIIDRLYESSLEEKKAYLANLEGNLENDGFYQMSLQEKIAVFAALIDVDLKRFCNPSYLKQDRNEYQQHYGKLNTFLGKAIKDSCSTKEKEQEMEDLIAVASFTHGKIKVMNNPSYHEPYANLRQMPLGQKASILKASFKEHFSYRNQSSEEKFELLSIFGYVNIREFRDEKSAIFNKKEFAIHYRTQICEEWKKLAEKNEEGQSLRRGCYRLGLKWADELDRIALQTAH